MFGPINPAQIEAAAQTQQTSGNLGGLLGGLGGFLGGIFGGGGPAPQPQPQPATDYMPLLLIGIAAVVLLKR